MNHLRRIISLLLVLVLCFGLIPGVSAAEVDTPGTDTQTEVTEAEETVPTSTEDTQPTEEPPPETESEPEESDAPADVPMDEPGLMAAASNGISTWSIGSTQKSIMLFDYADNGNYTTVLNSQVACAYKPNGSGTTRTAYIKNLGWHFARYGGVPYADDPLYCIEPWRSYAASTSGNSVDRDVTLDGSGSTTGSNVWYDLPAARREAIGLILLYSNQMWNHSISVTTTKRDNNPNDVTVKAGETTVDTWLNKEQGLVWFYKKTNIGESVEGWHITVYTDEACTQKVGTLITNDDGRAGYYLDPGTYWAKETGDEHGRFEDEYWMVDETVQKFEIKPHEDVSITFTNVQYGRLKITKTVEGGGSLAGWQFKITDAGGKVLDGSPFATDEDGIILTRNLLPGTYTVEELLPEDSLYECKSDNPQTVTVKQGEIAEVAFVNALRTGKVTVEKIDITGSPLARATFRLEWSAEGSLWYPVTYSESIVRGGCSNPDVADGSLTTGADGILEWGNLYPGLQYRLTETKAPDGYKLLENAAYEGELPADDLALSVRVTNTRTFTMPDTGANAAMIFRILSMFSGTVCLAMLIYSKKRLV